MGIVRVSAFSISIDGFGAGPNQDLNNPLGVRGTELHQWFFNTRKFREMTGQNGGADGVDNQIAGRAMENIGAWVIGRNMFGPVRGNWPDESWKGWWGENPPYHTPVFVLTHHARAPLKMEGGTTFYFITDGIDSALKRAKDCAKNKDVRIGGGISVIQQYLRAEKIDEIHLVQSPIVLGVGENLFAGIDLHTLGFRCVENIATSNVTHLTLKKSL